MTVRLEGILSGHQGRIDPQHREVQILVPANDQPYGVVSFERDSVITNENDKEDDVASVAVKRRFEILIY